jgi:hypothetical protein
MMPDTAPQGWPTPCLLPLRVISALLLVAQSDSSGRRGVATARG